MSAQSIPPLSINVVTHTHRKAYCGAYPSFFHIGSPLRLDARRWFEVDGAFYMDIIFLDNKKNHAIVTLGRMQQIGELCLDGAFGRVVGADASRERLNTDIAPTCLTRLNLGQRVYLCGRFVRR